MDSLRRKLQRDLKSKKGIRASELYDFAKRRGVNKLRVKELLDQSISFINNKSWNSNKNPRRDYQTVRITTTGFMQLDKLMSSR